MSEQALIINRAQGKDYSSNYTGQTSRKLPTRIKEHWAGLKNCNVKATLMISHCADTGRNIDLAETKILSHISSWVSMAHIAHGPSLHLGDLQSPVKSLEVEQSAI